MKKRFLTVFAAISVLVAMLISFSVSAYGGSFSLQRSDTDGAEAPSLEIAYQNLSFRDNVCIKFAVGLKGVTDASLLVWTEPQSEYLYGTQKAVLDDVGTQTIDGGTYYIYDYTELSAKQMTDEIYVRAYASVDGNAVYSQVKKYSILEYALRITGQIGYGKDLTDDPTLISMVEQMLEYGTAAQKHFRYKLDRLANAEYGEVIVSGGVLSNGFDSGIYPVNSTVEISATVSDASGEKISHWVDYYGKRLLSSNEKLSLRVVKGTIEYTPVFASELLDGAAPFIYENFCSADVVSKIKALIASNPSGFKAYVPSVGKFSPLANDFISDGKILSISFPVYSVSSPDENGNYSFTVSVFNKNNLGGTSLRDYNILVNKDDYDLTKLSWIEVDVSGYDIVLSKNETIALCGTNDTLFPAYAGNSSVTSALPSDYVGFYKNIGKSNQGIDAANALVLDIRIARENPEYDKKVTETLYNDTLVNTIKEYIRSDTSKFKKYNIGGGPYAIPAEEFLSDGQVVSIGMPVTTSTADRNGNYKFTIYVFGKDLNTGLKAAPRRTYEIAVNGTQYGLTNGCAIKWIDLDLSDYDIVLGKDETLGFSSDGTSDTLIPYYNSTTMWELIDNNTDNGSGLISGMGTGSITIQSQNSLLLNVMIERDYTYSSMCYADIVSEKQSYDAMISALKSKYAGKKISIIGDSISTFRGYSNSTTYNSTIGGNAVYYGNNSNISTVDQTYWMKLIDALDMELCVNNSWSGGRIYGKSDTSYKDSSVFRSTQLHRDTEGSRVDPDVIVFFCGINDINNNVKFGDLLQTLGGVSTREEELEIVDGWFKALLANNASGSVAGSTYKTFQEAYALSLYNMRSNYANAEIYCVNLMPCEKYLNNNGGTYDVMEDYNYFYELMVDYFDLELVDQYSDISQNYYSYSQYYTNFTDFLHPNAGGHTRLAKRILEAMGKKNGFDQ